MLGLFALVELHRRHPMLDLRLFTNPRFTAASLSVTALYFCLFGTIFFQTQHLQFVLGYDPLGAGLRSLPFAVVLLVVANTTPRLVRWAGTRAVITTGLGVVAVAMALRAGFTVHTGYPAILLTQCVFALGMGLTIAPATASIMGAVPAGRAGVGSAINDTTRQVGGALGVAVMGSIGASIYRHSASHALSRGPPVAGPVGPGPRLDRIRARRGRLAAVGHGADRDRRRQAGVHPRRRHRLAGRFCRRRRRSLDGMAIHPRRDARRGSWRPTGRGADSS